MKGLQTGIYYNPKKYRYEAVAVNHRDNTDIRLLAWCNNEVSKEARENWEKLVWGKFLHDSIFSDDLENWL